MTDKLLTEYHLEFLSLKAGHTCSLESSLVKMPLVGNHTSRLNCKIVSSILTISMLNSEVEYLDIYYIGLDKQTFSA